MKEVGHDPAFFLGQPQGLCKSSPCPTPGGAIPLLVATLSPPQTLGGAYRSGLMWSPEFIIT